MPTQLPEAARQLLAAGLRPERADWTVDQGWENYSAADHATWKMLYERQTKVLAGRACDAFLDGLRTLPLGGEGIPDFRHLSDVLMKRTGWQVVAVQGLVPDDVFYEHLANRRFVAGNFIRKPNELDYLEEPDVFHDVFGHVPLLANPVFADYMQAFGEGGLRALRLGSLTQLARVYWYTVEFGLVQQADGLRIYGAGIASSAGESVFALADPSPHRIGFDLERVMRTRYRIDDFQETYFVLRSLDDLLELAHVDFEPVYAAARELPEVDANQLLAADRVAGRGTGAYAAARQHGA